MRLRVEVDWDGVTIDDQVHDVVALRLGPGPDAQVSLPASGAAAIEVRAYGTLALMEVPVALVAALRWDDGEEETLLRDRSVALSPQLGTCELTLRDSFASTHPTRVRITTLAALPVRRDVALAGWGAAAILLATYLTAGIAYTAGAKDAALTPARIRAQAAGSDRWVRWTVDPALPLVDDGTGVEATLHPGEDSASEYARLLVQGFERYVQRDLLGAERWWTRAAALSPERPEAFINLAQLARQRHDLAKAESLLRVSLSLSPQRCEALTDLGLVEAMRGGLDEGRATLGLARSACAGRLGFVELYLAAVLGNAGDIDRARGALERALEALVADSIDKRREALFDLEHEPLFAPLRSTASFATSIARLRASLAHPA